MVVFKEAARPVCSPAWAAEHAETLAGPPPAGAGRHCPTCCGPTRARARWKDWFALAGHRTPGRGATPPRPRQLHLRAGSCRRPDRQRARLARHCVGRFLEAGTLLALGDEFVEFDSACYGALTGKGPRKPLARRGLAFFDLDGTESLCGSSRRRVRRPALQRGPVARRDLLLDRPHNAPRETRPGPASRGWPPPTRRHRAADEP